MIGWIHLSKKAVARAEEALSDDQQGVRDEIGFLALHQAFADRFFPGTSVLHTRLRYVLFVPWLMQRSGGSAARFREDSLRFTKQLIESGSEGVIGGHKWPREPSYSAAMIYWSALARWGILHTRPGQAPSTRAQVLRRLAAAQSATASSVTIDGEPTWATDTSPFVELPAPPADLLKAGKPMDFVLVPLERAFLRRHLMAVNRSDGAQSLLARLAESPPSMRGIDVPWHKVIRRVADNDDRRYLELAEQASALAGIGRAVYAALVEEAKNRDTGERLRTYREALARLREEHESCALNLDIDALQSLVPGLPASLMRVLAETQAWLRQGKQSVSDLEEAYRLAESGRKGQRTRLGRTLGAQTRRAEWNTSGMPHPFAEVLHYRWAKVRVLLHDLGSQ